MDLNLYDLESFDYNTVSLYAKEKCNTCYGRGYVIVQLGNTKSGAIRKNGEKPIRTFARNCSCTLNNRKKWRMNK